MSGTQGSELCDIPEIPQATLRGHSACGINLPVPLSPPLSLSPSPSNARAMPAGYEASVVIAAIRSDGYSAITRKTENQYQTNWKQVAGPALLPPWC